MIATLSFLQSTRLIGRTFPGFRVLSDARVHHILSPTWTGAKAGLPWLHPIVAVDGVAVTSGRDLTARVAALPPGVPVTYTVRTASGLRPFTVVTQRFGLADWLVTSFAGWLLGVGTALSGAVVSWLRPGHPVARLHFRSCLLLASYFLAVADASGGYQVVTAGWYFVLYVVGFGAWGWLATAFPRPLHAIRNWQAGWLGAGLLTLTWCLVDLAAGRTTGVLVAWLGWGTLSALALPASAAFATWRRDATAHERAVGKVLLLGFSITFLFPIVDGWTLALAGQPSGSGVLRYLAMLGFPLTIAVAIARHRLFGIDLVLRQTFLYGLAAGGMLALYAGVAAVIRLAIGERTTVESVVAAMAIAVAFGPWRDRLKLMLDRRFFRASYDPTAVMADFFRRASAAPDPAALIATYAVTLDEALAVRGVTVRLADGREHHRGDPSGGGAPLILPLTFDAETLGTVWIGTKRSDLPFTEMDRRLIDELTHRLELWVHLVQRIEAERRQQDLIDSLRQADEMKSEFLNLVSHELRRPVSEALAAVDLLVHYQGKPQAEARTTRTLQRLQSSVGMLAVLMSDLIDAGQLQSGRFRLCPGPLDIAQLVADALDATRAMAEQKGVQLTADVPACPEAWGDPLRLTQVLQNLLVNAVQHTPAGGTITVTVALEPDHWVLAVADTGSGIAAAARPGLFQRFGGLKPGEAREGGGLGLGLYICKSITEAHGGTIGVTSEVERGSTFRLRLPLGTRGRNG